MASDELRAKNDDLRAESWFVFNDDGTSYRVLRLTVAEVVLAECERERETLRVDNTRLCDLVNLKTQKCADLERKLAECEREKSKLKRESELLHALLDDAQRHVARILDLEHKLAECERERDEANNRTIRLEKLMGHDQSVWKARIADLERKLARLTQAARTVDTLGEHASDCPFRPDLTYAPAISTCSCGMLELRAALTEAGEQEKKSERSKDDSK